MPGPGALIHLRRVSGRHGVPVTACSGAPIRVGTRVRFANGQAQASCPRCLDYAKRLEAREQRKATA